MGATTDNYVVISADCHGGADITGYRPYLASKFHEDFDAWAAEFENPYEDNTNADADRNWSSERRLREMEADGVVSPPAGGKREVLVDQHYFETVDAQLR